MKRIRIANPRLGGAKEISVRRAEKFVQRGIAAWLPDGGIRFVEQARLRHQAAELRQTLREEAQEFARNRGGIVFWNGADNPSLMQRPGEDWQSLCKACHDRKTAVHEGRWKRRL